MIKLTENTDLPSVNFTDGFSMTKIKANLFAYGCGFSFLNLWYQQNEKGDITALIEKIENNLLIVANDDADFVEIKNFILAIGFSSVQGMPEILKKLDLDFKEFQVLELWGDNNENFPPYPDIKEVYSILYSEKNNNIKHTDFEGFYVDLSHKIRNGFAAATVHNNAVSVASHITKNSAVISGVAVRSGHRKSGLGSSVLKEMLSSLGRRKIFVAAEESVVPFYIKNGFLKTYKTAIYETEEQ